MKEKVKGTRIKNIRKSIKYMSLRIQYNILLAQIGGFWKYLSLHYLIVYLLCY